MPEPVITARQPERITLSAGSYSWCTCGHTKKGALCDASHIGKGFCPQTFVIDATEGESRTVGLCQCRHTKNLPYCDGSHRALPGQ